MADAHLTVEMHCRTVEVIRESDGCMVVLVEVYTTCGQTLYLCVHDPRLDGEDGYDDA